MMCDKCGKNLATTHIHAVVNGVVTEQNLCGYCAVKGGYANFGQLSLANMLASMFGDSIEAGITPAERCSCCGSSFSDIVESGRAGCAECYNSFHKQLLPSLQRLHGRTNHTGKIPTNFNKEPSKDQILIKLKEDLVQVIKNEEFEKAAELRDEIRKLEGTVEEQ